MEHTISALKQRGKDASSTLWNIHVLEEGRGQSEAFRGGELAWVAQVLDMAVHIQHICAAGDVAESGNVCGNDVPHHRYHALGGCGRAGVIDVGNEEPFYALAQPVYGGGTAIAQRLAGRG